MIPFLFYRQGPVSTLLRQQQTISRTVAVSGFGYWSSRDLRVEFRPALPDTGIVFVRDDLQSSPRIPARIDRLIATPRRTSLSRQGGRVEMVEHILAALAALRIDNCEVWANGLEMPAGDGSSQHIVTALEQTGVVLQRALRRRITVDRQYRVGDKSAWIIALPPAGPFLRLQYTLDYGPTHPIGPQTYALEVTPETFKQHLAPARTFVMESEAQWLRSQGLGLRATYQDLLVFNQQGPISNQLHFPNECVRHKILDMVGDLSLCGCELHGQFIAYRSGHQLNAQMVQQLVAAAQSRPTLKMTA